MIKRKLGVASRQRKLAAMQHGGESVIWRYHGKHRGIKRAWWCRLLTGNAGVKEAEAAVSISTGRRRASLTLLHVLVGYVLRTLVMFLSGAHAPRVSPRHRALPRCAPTMCGMQRAVNVSLLKSRGIHEKQATAHLYWRDERFRATGGRRLAWLCRRGENMRADKRRRRRGGGRRGVAASRRSA